MAETPAKLDDQAAFKDFGLLFRVFCVWNTAHRNGTEEKMQLQLVSVLHLISVRATLV